MAEWFCCCCTLVVVGGLVVIDTPTPPAAAADHNRLTGPLALQGVSGFLPKKDAAAVGRTLAPGALVEVVVGPGGLRPGGGSAGGSVTVTASPEAVASAAAKEWEGLNIGEGGRWDGSWLARAAYAALLLDHTTAWLPHSAHWTGRFLADTLPHHHCLLCRISAAWPAGDGARAQRAVGWPSVLLPHLLHVSCAHSAGVGEQRF